MKKFILLTFSSLLVLMATAQQTSYRSYLIYLRDKANSMYSVDQPEAFLSMRAIERRKVNHVEITEQDLPVNQNYLNAIHAQGAKILFTSKWLNTVTVAVDTSLIIDKINDLPFVLKSEPVYKHAVKVLTDPEPNVSNTLAASYGEAYWQVNMLNGLRLHQMGYTGKDVLLAVIDAGFNHVDSLQAFQKIFEENRVFGTWDFVNQSPDVYDFHNHGMIVLSVIGGQIDGKLKGTAPDANFVLLRSENGESEFPIEEDAWIAAAEYADSIGANVINTSLGYSVFDSANMNHSYADMNGHTTRISIGANIAFSKGILVVCSAGNEGNDPWHYITSPADADSVLSVGAVDYKGNHAFFSSWGPSSDGDVKPNVAAMGLNTVAASTTDGEIAYTAGTSLSSPLIAGMSACLVGAFPAVPVRDIKQAIEKSGYSYMNPNDSLGYGIPDYYLAYQILALQTGKNEQNLKILETYPNPFTSHLAVSTFCRDAGEVTLTLRNTQGQIISELNYDSKAGEVRKSYFSFPYRLQAGVYYLMLSNGKEFTGQKLIHFN